MSLKDLDQKKLSIAVNSALNILSTGVAVVKTVQTIATTVTNFYTAFVKDTGLNGASKKDIVLQLVQQTWDMFIGSDTKFSDWSLKITQFIDALHASYKSLTTDLSAIKNVLFGGNSNAENAINTTV